MTPGGQHIDTSPWQIWHCGLSDSVELVAFIELKGLVELKGPVRFIGFIVGSNVGNEVGLRVGKTPPVWLSAPNAASAPICGKVVGKHFSDAITTMVP